MNPASFNSSSSSPLHFIDLNEDDHQHLISNNPPQQQQLLPTSSLSCPIFFNLSQHHYQSGSTHPKEFLQNQNKVEKFGLLGGSSESKSSTSSSSDDGLSVKWMSSKMRVMRKMMASNSSRTDKSVVHKFNDQRSEINSNIHHYSSAGIVRVCSDCNTTKTPLWRGGPQGPKSLCNACGIRQRKARKAMALAAVVANATTQTDSSTSTNKTKDKQGKESHASYVVQPKHVKLGGTNCPRNTRKHLSFEDFALSLIGKNSTNFQDMFPQDEEEAAILLMALSYGFTHN